MDKKAAIQTGLCLKARLNVWFGIFNYQRLMSQNVVQTISFGLRPNH